MAYSYLRNGEEAEDCIQELFLKVLSGKVALEKVENIPAFMATSIRNMALDRLKKQTALSLNTDDNNLVNPERNLENQELGEEIDRAISDLPPKTRAVFVMKRLEDKSYKEIAQELDISTNTVENHITKALKYLRKSLKHHLLSVFLTF